MEKGEDVETGIKTGSKLLATILSFIPVTAPFAPVVAATGEVVGEAAGRGVESTEVADIDQRIGDTDLAKELPYVARADAKAEAVEQQVIEQKEDMQQALTRRLGTGKEVSPVSKSMRKIASRF